MRILFLLYFDVTDTSQIGVAKKVKYQIHAMKYLNHNIDLAYCKNGELLVERDGEILESFPAPCGRTHYRHSVYKVLKRISVNYDMVLIRFPGSIDYTMYRTFGAIKKNNAKVVLEMPTYPIGGEMRDLLKKLYDEHLFFQLIKRGIVYGIHRVISRHISKKVYCIMSYSENDYIWGTRVINIENGIDCDAISLKRLTEKNDNKLHMIFVAVFATWHGLDRLIAGLKDYYLNKDEEGIEVELTLVGHSEELNRITYSEDFKSVKDHVRVVGSKFGTELDEEYNNADIAISSLGMHRIGLYQGSTLKTREYCAKGIPFVYGYKEKGIDESFPYAYRVPADDTPIDIRNIVKFYYNIQNKDYVHEMHEFSNKYDWKYQMKMFFEEYAKIEG